MFDIESKIWTYAETGTKVHAFVDGVAICRENIRVYPARVERSGRDYAGAVYYASVCANCLKKFNAALEAEERFNERLKASMQPSTGEGDHLPPATTTANKEETVMDANDTVWGTTRTGCKFHAFKDGRALCRSSIRDTDWGYRYTLHAARYQVLVVSGRSICEACRRSFNFEVGLNVRKARVVEEHHAEALEMNAQIDATNSEETDMKRRNYTAGIRKQVAAGRVAVSSVGPEYLVAYEPRSKSDPQPWTSGIYRYNGREVHTVESCGVRMISMKTAQVVYCTKARGHDKAHSSTHTN